MSDILIKGMEMPTSCASCDIACRHYLDFGVDGLLSKIYRTESRRPDCPLIPVPPHGRLIDTDAVSLEGGPYEYDDWCKWALDQYQDAPTIIPATVSIKG